MIVQNCCKINALATILPEIFPGYSHNNQRRCDRFVSCGRGNDSTVQIYSIGSIEIKVQNSNVDQRPPGEIITPYTMRSLVLFWCICGQWNWLHKNQRTIWVWQICPSEILGHEPQSASHWKIWREHQLIYLCRNSAWAPMYLLMQKFCVWSNLPPGVKLRHKRQCIYLCRTPAYATISKLYKTSASATMNLPVPKCGVCDNLHPHSKLRPKTMSLPVPNFGVSRVR